MASNFRPRRRAAIQATHKIGELEKDSNLAPEIEDDLSDESTNANCAQSSTSKPVGDCFRMYRRNLKSKAPKKEEPKKVAKIQTSDQSGTYIIRSFTNTCWKRIEVPATRQMLKINYEDEESPTFRMEVEEYDEPEEEEFDVNLEKSQVENKENLEVAPVKPPKPDYSHTISDVVHDLKMWCDTNSVIILTATWTSEVMSFAQVKYLKEAHERYSNYLLFIDNERKRGVEIVYEDSEQTRNQVSTSLSTISAKATSNPIIATQRVNRMPVIQTNRNQQNALQQSVLQQQIRQPTSKIPLPVAQLNNRVIFVPVSFSTTTNPGQNVIIGTARNALPQQTLLLPPNVIPLNSGQAMLTQLPISRIMSQSTIPASIQNPSQLLRVSTAPYSILQPPRSSIPATASHTVFPSPISPTMRPRPESTVRAVVQNPKPATKQSSSNLSKQAPTDSELLSLLSSPNTFDTLDDFRECFCIVKGNNPKPYDLESFLSIKPLPIKWPSSANTLINSLVKLDQMLLKSEFKGNPAAWMISKHLISRVNCPSCGKILSKVRKESEEIRWVCDEPCGKLVDIERPKIFADHLSCIPLPTLLFSIYYWAIQMDVVDIVRNKRINLALKNVSDVWTMLRKICAGEMISHQSKMKFKYSATLATAHLGTLYLIGAMEETSNIVRIAVIDSQDINEARFKTVPLLLQYARKWFYRQCRIKVCEKKLLNLNKFGYSVTLVPRQVFTSSKNEIGFYLTQHLTGIFQDINVNELDKETINLLLNELQWREIYGTEPLSSFVNIIQHISEKLDFSPKSADELFYVEEYYYATLKPKLTLANSIIGSSKVDIRCPICSQFFDNILIVKHYIQHVQQVTRLAPNAVNSLSVKCDHCLRQFSERILPLHHQLYHMKPLRFSCRICCMPFFDRDKYLIHMTKTHFSGEMPYVCECCSYRSSFHKDLINHFEKEHIGWSKSLCPFCLQVFESKSFRNNFFGLYSHIEQHIRKQDSNVRCNRCCLTFNNNNDFLNHKTHIAAVHSANSILTPYQVKEDEKAFCTKASEKELRLFAFKASTYYYKKSDNYEVISSVNRNLSEVPFQLRIANCYWTSNLFENKPVLMNAFISHPLKCFECKDLICNDHFIRQTMCPKCPYKTHCKKSLNKHMNSVTAHTREDHFSPLSIASLLYNCDCGFKTTSGNTMATHLATSQHSRCTLNQIDEI
ncbi:uncharacterized protein B4U79_18346 [Dinothrombium tinctorium]|uniref:C2H2-type domain-containing protein n=1 Tax=Dinothrombium tinctorium TaxID=1965070 RepID=A0A3S3NL52_9ACAR|nr:uncharacterized protein B4U79_18346 [Dinothrombium tinctorium]